METVQDLILQYIDLIESGASKEEVNKFLTDNGGQELQSQIDTYLKSVMSSNPIPGVNRNTSSDTDLQRRAANRFRERALLKNQQAQDLTQSELKYMKGLVAADTALTGIKLGASAWQTIEAMKALKNLKPPKLPTIQRNELLKSSIATAQREAQQDDPIYRKSLQDAITRAYDQDNANAKRLDTGGYASRLQSNNLNRIRQARQGEMDLARLRDQRKGRLDRLNQMQLQEDNSIRRQQQQQYNQQLREYQISKAAAARQKGAGLTNAFSTLNQAAVMIPDEIKRIQDLKNQYRFQQQEAEVLNQGKLNFTPTYGNMEIPSGPTSLTKSQAPQQLDTPINEYGYNPMLFKQEQPIPQFPRDFAPYDFEEGQGHIPTFKKLY